jgi:hypothetical protein
MVDQSFTRIAVAALAGGCISLAGCDASGGRVSPPSVKPQAMAQAALAQYDSNSDQALSGDELARCPGLKSSLALGDANKDGKLTADEIAGRLKTFVDANIGLVGLSARFTLDGQALEGARVVLTPEKFIAAAVQPAAGVTTPEGVGFFQVSQDLPGVQPGIYRLEVYRPAADGKETIPARYNAETILGVDAGVDGPDVNNRVHFALTSK